jgi:hypothetical protein
MEEASHREEPIQTRNPSTTAPVEEDWLGRVEAIRFGFGKIWYIAWFRCISSRSGMWYRRLLRPVVSTTLSTWTVSEGRDKATHSSASQSKSRRNGHPLEHMSSPWRGAAQYLKACLKQASNWMASNITVDLDWADANREHFSTCIPVCNYSSLGELLRERGSTCVKINMILIIYQFNKIYFFKKKTDILSKETK